MPFPEPQILRGYLVELQEQHDGHHYRLDILGEFRERGLGGFREWMYEVQNQTDCYPCDNSDGKHPVLYEFDYSRHVFDFEVQISRNN